MTVDKLKLPLQEGGYDFEKHARGKRSRKVQIVAGIFFLVVVNISLFVFAVLTMSRMKRLENEVDRLKDNIKILDENLANTIAAYEDVGAYEDGPDTNPDSDPELYVGNLEDPVEYFDYENYDQDRNFTEEIEKDPNFLLKDFSKLEYQRKKRNIVAATQDGVLVNSESYAERRARNHTKNRNYPARHTTTPTLSSSTTRGAGYTATSSVTPHGMRETKAATRTPPPVYTRRSRVMHVQRKQKPLRQFAKHLSLRSGDDYTNGGSSEGEFTIVRDETLGRRRSRPLEILDERHPRVGRVRLPSIQYSGDTSRYVLGQHTNFKGNGHLRHPQRTFVDWKLDDWVNSTEMETRYTMEDGVLTIKEPGVYFIYAQVYYLDEHDTVGYRVQKNSETILQCTITVHSTERGFKGNTCFTAGMEFLSEGDTISLGDVTSGRYSLFEPGKSFFGLVKFSDVRSK